MKKNKKNGFTLIELLAVLVILSAIALIAMPQVLKVISESKESATIESIKGVLKTSENYVSQFMLANDGAVPSVLEFKCESSGCKLQTSGLTEYNLEKLDKLDFKGTRPTTGTITIYNPGNIIVANDLNINGYTCSYFDKQMNCGGIGTIENGEVIEDYKGNQQENGSSTIKKGDVNGDGVVNILDFNLLGTSYTADEEDQYISVADMNGDGKITMTDIIMLGRMCEYLPGDVNGDGVVNILDAQLLGRSYTAGEADQYLPVGDMNGDGKITMDDILMLGRMCNYLPGDVDEDGKITSKDLILLGKFINSALTTDEKFNIINADYNQDGVIDMDDIDKLKTDNNYLPGDVNEDGHLSLPDVIMLGRYINGTLADDQTINEINADYNQDGIIDMDDVNELGNFIAS